MQTNYKVLNFHQHICQLIFQNVEYETTFFKKKTTKNQIGQDPGSLAQKDDSGIFKDKSCNGVKKRTAKILLFKFTSSLRYIRVCIIHFVKVKQRKREIENYKVYDPPPHSESPLFQQQSPVLTDLQRVTANITFCKQPHNLLSFYP